MKPRARLAAGVLAVLFLALHLPFLPQSLEDVDSINFAMGVHDFDVTRHQPHPPGYPLFILLAKGAHAVIASDARALASVGIVLGALSAVALVVLFGRLDGGRQSAELVVAAAAITVTSPLFWVTADRPLSDVAGLAAALGVQALTLSAAGVGGLAIASFLAAFAAGIRSQVLWLTVPLLAMAFFRVVQRGPDGTGIPAGSGRGWLRRHFKAAVAVKAAFGAGILAWAIPLVVLTGGPAAYWKVLFSQGAEDLSGVAMLWTNPTPRQLALAMYYAFVAPWAIWQFATVMLVLAAIGVWRVFRHNRFALTALAVAFGPYLLFDLFFQETVTTRYALPLVVPIAYLTVWGSSALPRRFALALLGAVVAVNLAVAESTLYAYSRSESPAFRLLADMRSAQSQGAAPTAVLAMHRREDFDLRRPAAWVGDRMPAFGARLAAPAKHEWLQLVSYWNAGGRNPIWFVADPLRSDLALVNHPGGRMYRWPLAFPVLIGGVRPNEMDWYAIEPPDWYLGEGWAVTPETAGIAREDHKGPSVEPIRGWIRRWPMAATLMVGGRNLAAGGPGQAHLRVAVDGRLVDEATVAPGFFLEMIDLPAAALSGSGDYAVVTVSADSDQIAIEQFDAKPVGSVIFGYSEGWHEQEYNPSTGRLWHWTSERASLRVRSERRALLLRFEGETETFRKPSHIVIRAGDEVLDEEDVGDTFSVAVGLPAALFERGETTISIETDQVYVPGERRFRRSNDRRHLGLKIYQCSIRPPS